MVFLIIKQLNVKNKNINYKNVEFEFSNCGIYLISGENGSGKTCILEEIVFGKYEAIFEEPELLTIWEKNRGSLFTYIPQNVCENDLYVYEYIAKENKDIDLNNTIKLLKDFSLTEDILSKKFKLLSGGEKKKIQIISGLLKDRKFIFIDEPSNNLDDISTNILNKKLNELKDNHVIVLITHDERLNFEYNHIYKLNKVIIEKETNDVSRSKLDFSNITLVKKPYLRIVAKLLKNIPHFLTIALTLIALIFIDLFVLNHYLNHFNNETFIQENLILTQSTSEYDAEYYKNYVSSEKISIDNENKYRYINLNDVVDIGNIDGIEKIYILDIEYLSCLRDDILDDTVLNDIHYVAIPEDYQTLYLSSYLDIGLGVIEGVLPKDNKNEASISKKCLIKYYGYTTDNVSTAIGDYISLEINGVSEEYLITGFNEYDYITVSYSDKYSFGIYNYSVDTYKDFAVKIYEYQKEMDAVVGIVDELVIITKNGMEKKVVNKLLESYPAIYMQSNYIASTWARNYNRNLFIKALVVTALISLVMGIISYFINRKTIQYNLRLIDDFETYYISKRTMKSLYIVSGLFIYFVFYISLIITNFFLNFGSYLDIFISISFILIIIPISLSYFGLNSIGKRR